MVDDEQPPSGRDEPAGNDSGDQPARIAVTLAAAHLIEAAVAAHLAPSHAALATRLGLSRSRLSNLVGLTALSPDLQQEVLELRSSGPLGRVTERTVLELCATRPSWNVQRWWWSLLRQPFEPTWLADGVPARLAFPSGTRARRGAQAIGDAPLPWLVDVAAARGHRHTRRREDLLVALAAGGAVAPVVYPDVALALAMPASRVVGQFERLYGRRPACRHPDYARRRVAWAVQAVKLGGMPKPIAGKVMELKEHLPERRKDAFASIARVHVTRVHRVDRRLAA